MIRKYLKLSMLLALVVGAVSCNKGMDTDDEKEIIANEALIDKYLADSSLTGKVTHESTGIVYYKRKVNATGEAAKTGDAATVKVIGYLLNGTKVLGVANDSSLTFPVGGNTTGIGGIELGIYLMRTGEKASLFLPYYLGFGSGAQTNVPAYSPIRMEMEFIKTRTEVQQINEYLAAKQFVPSERSTDNLIIIRTNTVTGDTLGSGKSVSVKYTGKLLDGTQFDTGTIPVTTGTGGVIPGFDRAVRRMRKTEKAIIIFPSSLGYKGTSNAKIAAYSPLQFELEIL